MSELVGVLYSSSFRVELPADKVAQLQQAGQVEIAAVGFYVDPIDGTNEYVKAKVSKEQLGGGLHPSGIQVCTVLIGAFDMTTGVPFAGVAAQPFSERGEDGRWGPEVCYWGWAVGEARVHNLPHLPQEKPLVLLSAKESAGVRRHIQEKYATRDVTGVGNKLLCVAVGVAHAYYFSPHSSPHSKSHSTYKWDTCAVHAILRSLGGEIVDSVQFCPIAYQDPEASKNDKGILACRSAGALTELKEMLAAAALKRRRSSSDGTADPAPAAHPAAAAAATVEEATVKRQRTH